MKTTFDSINGFNFAYRVEGVEPGYHRFGYGKKIRDIHNVNEFKMVAKSFYVGAKKKPTISAVRLWVKENKPSQFWACWKTDTDFYKDDSVQVWYL